MKDYTAEELFKLLNQQDECDWIEAKGGHESSHSVMETVCAFANEPSLGGGYILLGVAEDKASLIPQYKTVHITDPDSFQKDFVSQCSSMFNIPVRPKVTVERVHGDTIIKVRVDELSLNQKPFYFKADGLPQGAYRRIGPTDQRCNEDDLRVFYADYQGYDQTPVTGTSLEDIDENALKRYRTLREKVNAAAEELSYSDAELLEALGCVNKQNKSELNLSGLVLFGSSKALRAHMPMLRVDYIRVPGNVWVQDPDDRFTTIDMRGPLLTLVFRLIEAINNDLPRGFLLSDGEMQAKSVGLPSKALREAIVNAVMHRSYREHRPIQVIRYDNRIEIINPGYSLKAEDKLGEPGSETRNPFIAAVFHETNLAETKGSGIRAMRKLMASSHLAPPTFDSDRNNNQFVTRLLLHHFLDQQDVDWLAQFAGLQLNDSQKQALIFVREVGAIDNHKYRQMADCDTLKASIELRSLKNHDLLEPKGKGKGTYYIAGKKLSTPAQDLSAPPQELSTLAQHLSTPPQDLSNLAQDLSTPPTISKELENRINELNQREHDHKKVGEIIKEICAERAVKASHIANILGKGEKYIKRQYLKEMIKSGELKYLHPELINHPEQAYIKKGEVKR
ncbi:putative DNA binding domain-containing protein [Echinicola marina]|uniref:ATP-binding protein n=1 Tax=Echinicola marina TaxID=2859768 RepID=UPI001CF66E13|nr:ATP-binding protein [Echinicola marina]UCS92498.1 putative DNA binding domain-containing protein [Echinicola marina]